MSDFSTMLAADAAAFLSTFDWEAVTYTPAGDGATPLTINALIDREGARLDNRAMPGIPMQSNKYTVYIQNDASEGVTSINTGGDTISFPDRVGGSAATHLVRRVVRADAGLWVLGCD